jgi:hypothetical protein
LLPNQSELNASAADEYSFSLRLTRFSVGESIVIDAALVSSPNAAVHFAANSSAVIFSYMVAGESGLVT